MSNKSKIIKLISTKTKHFYTKLKSKNKKKIYIKKFDPVINKHVYYKEYKIK